MKNKTKNTDKYDVEKYNTPFAKKYNIARCLMKMMSLTVKSSGLAPRHTRSMIYDRLYNDYYECLKSFREIVFLDNIKNFNTKFNTVEKIISTIDALQMHYLALFENEIIPAGQMEDFSGTFDELTRQLTNWRNKIERDYKKSLDAQQQF